MNYQNIKQAKTVERQNCEQVKATDFNEEIYNQYYDSVGNYHFTGTKTGKHIIKPENAEFQINLFRTDRSVRMSDNKLNTAKIPEVIFKQGFDEELYIDGELACVHKNLIIADVLFALENRGIITAKIEDETR